MNIKEHRKEQSYTSAHSYISAIIQRFLVQSLIIIACWHIITVWLQQDTDWYAAFMAFLWSGNMFWFKDYLTWIKNN